MNVSLSEPLMGIMGLGSTELIVILVIVLLLFGGAKLPSLARGLGQSIKEFKKAKQEAADDDEPATPAKKSPPAEAKKPETTTHGSN